MTRARNVARRRSMPLRLAEHLAVPVAIVVSLVLATGAGAAPISPSAPAADALPVVSLTFDDGNIDQLLGVDILDRYDLDGTFFVQSGALDTDGYFSTGDLTRLSAAGHEIGSHTTGHVDLSTISRDEAVRQVCTDRANLADLGFVTTSFAYPFAGFSESAKAAVQECGFSSARLLGGVESHEGCNGCPPVESIPPLDAFALLAPAQVTEAWSFDNLKSLVVQAQAAGGWMPITFHRVCETVGCSSIGVTTQTLEQFASYLRDEAAAGRVAVKTVDEVIGGEAKPVRQGDWPVGQTAKDGNRVVNAQLDDWTTGASAPSCWTPNTWGAHTAKFTRTADGGGLTVAVSDYESGSSSLMPNLDLGECAPAAEPGAVYDLSATYASTTATQFAVYLRDARGAWRYWDSSPWFDPSASASTATWTTPPMPADATALSFGLTVFSNGSLTLDAASMVGSGAVEPTPAATPTPTPTATSTPAATPTPTPTATATPAATATPTPTATPSTSATSTPTVTPKPPKPPVKPKTPVDPKCTKPWPVHDAGHHHHTSWGSYLNPAGTSSYDPYPKHSFSDGGATKHGSPSKCKPPRWW
ncbi:polysaccharide deacetylase [Pseudoclavibacter sp. RFBJ3]|uniref:polysaccharide deacetylase family protein n=1 Tax=unclassified Pseudoclavibacter TaxID=2615177 RepID=UPI000CE7E446|nr:MULTISPECIES: polysaccharide deacetylase family protein [unclassified Pseudoclavibacter]PPF86615.1 polysaccharide deacetylase [Pseudoclavibacter sp. RFBJ5]PPF94835.1 polysaccharide deacetylase [Pseudoclavibacter sp. RFBH5]PPF95347.1 polysaccharide deacetylase [Pseudoclavibacter sp. RFBJ3]PPG19493.1 polysaccharide deacetylase [Pseudoclavibacter sp. RFBI4]